MARSSRSRDVVSMGFYRQPMGGAETAPSKEGRVRHSKGISGVILWLPDPQPRAVLPPLPGKRTDGALWFEGSTRRAIAEDKVDMHRYASQRLCVPEDRLKQRDVRQGDKWLPWH
jgi:hypothetical protein